MATPTACTAGAAHARPYAAPALDAVGDLDELLEILGPAQANYGGAGFP